MRELNIDEGKGRTVRACHGLLEDASVLQAFIDSLSYQISAHVSYQLTLDERINSAEQECLELFPQPEEKF